ncbi:MAG: peptide deformylase [Desulfocapsaceae bacterium]|nr:peptide deformylase [Desulfocapsaceae bacterium]
MTLRTILTFPDPLLRRKAHPVITFDNALQKFVDDMAETMYDAPGIGLAATQIGDPRQVIVVDISKGKEQKEFMPLINPKIISNEGRQIDEEGCLSVPELTSNVKRFKKIVVSYQDLQGEELELEAEDRFAVVLQHEIDHLYGILFLDHLSPLKRQLYKKKIKKMHPNGEGPP